jgi:stage II sporulation SpoAA-like protein
MEHKAEWIEEPWIMRVTWKGRLTVADTDTLMKICLDAADKHEVNFLVDFREVKFHDPKIFGSTSLMSLIRHRNSKWFAFLGLTGVLQMAAQVLMTRSPFKSFTDEQKAIEFLRAKTEIQKAEAVEMAVAQKR